MELCRWCFIVFHKINIYNSAKNYHPAGYSQNQPFLQKFQTCLWIFMQCGPETKCTIVVPRSKVNELDHLWFCANRVPFYSSSFQKKLFKPMGILGKLKWVFTVMQRHWNLTLPSVTFQFPPKKLLNKSQELWWLCRFQKQLVGWAVIGGVSHTVSMHT